MEHLFLPGAVLGPERRRGKEAGFPLGRVLLRGAGEETSKLTRHLKKGQGEVKRRFRLQNKLWMEGRSEKGGSAVQSEKVQGLARRSQHGGKKQREKVGARPPWGRWVPFCKSGSQRRSHWPLSAAIAHAPGNGPPGRRAPGSDTTPTPTAGSSVS